MAVGYFVWWYAARQVKVEDAGFDWKILGPDVGDEEYVAWVCDQDAYACSGQKCSAQSILFMHENWRKEKHSHSNNSNGNNNNNNNNNNSSSGGGSGATSAFEARLAELAGRRQLDDLTVGPVLSLTTEEILEHAAAVAAIDGAYIAWGGKELNGGGHSAPPQYGMVEPTAVFVPREEMLKEVRSSHCPHGVSLSGSTRRRRDRVVFDNFIHCLTFFERIQ